jgi:hypothetical protein
MIAIDFHKNKQVILGSKIDYNLIMSFYKHTQIGYLMLVITAGTTALFVWLQLTARAEAPSVDSGANFALTAYLF